MLVSLHNGLEKCQSVAVIGYYREELTLPQAHYGASLTFSQLPPRCYSSNFKSSFPGQKQ